MLTEFVERLEKRFDEAIKKDSSTLESGAVADHAAYKRIVGHIAGLKEARDLLRKELANIHLDDDQLEEMNP